MPLRILVGVDLSFATQPTLKAARELARRTGARLRVVHVVGPVRGTRPGVRVDRDAAYRSARTQFDRMTSALSEVAAADLVTRPGAAGVVLEAESEQWGADIVVVGSHGKGWLDRVLVGSVTEHLLRSLHVPVLVVPVRKRRSASKPRLRRG